MEMHPSHPENDKGQVESVMGREMYDLQLMRNRLEMSLNEKVATSMAKLRDSFAFLVSALAISLLLCALPVVVWLWGWAFS